MRFRDRAAKYANTNGRVPMVPSDFITIAERCTQCHLTRRTCERTGGHQEQTGPCLCDAGHQWQETGRESTTGRAPWLANVPGLYGPGIHEDLTPGSTVWVGPSKVVVPPSGRLEVKRSGRYRLDIDDGHGAPPRAPRGGPRASIELFETPGHERGRVKRGAPEFGGRSRPTDHDPD